MSCSPSAVFVVLFFFRREVAVLVVGVQRLIGRLCSCLKEQHHNFPARLATGRGPGHVPGHFDRRVTGVAADAKIDFAVPNETLNYFETTVGHGPVKRRPSAGPLLLLTITFCVSGPSHGCNPLLPLN